MGIFAPTYGPVIGPVYPAGGSGMPWESGFGGGAALLANFLGATITRASEGSVLIAPPTDGTTAFLRWLPANQARVGYLGLLIEGSRTNAIATSNDPTNATSWSLFGTATANGTGLATNGPDGGQAWRIVAASGANGLAETTGSLLGGTVSVSSWVRSQTTSAMAPNLNLFLTASRTAIATAPVDTWQRLAITSADGGNASALVPVDGRDWSGIGGVVAGARDDRVFGMQRELGAFPSSYIRTAGAGATRAADIYTLASGTYSPSILSTGGYITFAPSAPSTVYVSASLEHRIVQVGASDYVRIRKNTNCVVELVCAGVVVASQTVTFSADQALGIRFAPASGSLTISGATIGNGTVTGAGAAWASGQTMYIGADNAGATNAYGHFSTGITP